MLSYILKTSLNNRFLVIFISVLIIAIGSLLLRQMDIDVFPDLTSPTVTIITEAEGLEAQEVERLVTFHLETAVNGSPGVRRIRSNSMLGVSLVWVEFEWGIDIYRARQIVSERLPLASENLPDGVSKPILAPISSIMGEIMLMGLYSDTLTPMEIKTVATWDILPQLKAVPGVAHVIAIGGESKQYQVQADPFKMEHYGVSLPRLAEAVSEANQNQSGGFINQYGNHYDIKVTGRIRQLDDLANATINKNDGTVVRVKDIARVSIGTADKIGDASLNARPAVILIVFKQPLINTLNLSKDLESRILELKSTLPSDLYFDLGIFRQADFVESAINNLKKTLLEGAVFVSIVLFLFLLNWRTTIISLVAIPLSLLTSVIVLYILGYTINTMSLGGLAIAIGVLVDDAIIDVENVFKRLRENTHLPGEEKKKMLQVVYEASLEIRSSIVIATLIIIVSFTPLFFLGGIEGRLLQPLGIAFIISLITSLIVAITLTPVLSSYFLGGKAILDTNREGSWVERKLRNLYRITLPFFLNSAQVWIVVTLLSLIGCIVIATGLGRSFLPEFNEGSIVITAVAKPGISIEESNKIGLQIEKLLLEMPQINKVSRRTGRAETDEHAQGINSSEFDAPFHLDSLTKELLPFINLGNNLSFQGHLHHIR